MQYRHNVDLMNRLEFVAHRREKDGQIQDLWIHLKEVSSLTGKFASVIGLGKQGKLIGLLHDIGKASLESDRYIRSATGLINSDEDDYVDFAKMKGKIDHASAGAQVLYRYFFDKGNVGLLTMQILSLAIASHHSGLIDCLAPDGDNAYTKRMQKADDKTRYKECISNLDSDIKEEINALLSDDSIVNLLNQKLCSFKGDYDKNDTGTFKLGLLTRFLFSCLIDADRLNTADFEFPEEAKQRNQGNYKSWSVLIEKLENRLKEFKCKNNVDKLRQDISNSCLQASTKPKGLYQLSVPTGGGKTLASLRFAINHAKEHKMDRVIYFIPYTSIIDQNAQTVREIFEEKSESGIYSNDIVLEHHSNLTPEEENTKQRLLSDNWDAPVVFTTMVQFLEAFFGSGTRSARRMHQLANTVIIFDEIQTLPIRCVHLFNVATQFLTQGCGSTVVLCTATQPLLGEVLPIQRALRLTPEQQMMPNVEKLFKELKRVEVYDRRKRGGWIDSEVAELTERELEETESVLIVVNTKKTAKSLFQQCLNHPNAQVYHLSTDMCPAHRMEILSSIKACLSDNKPIICVSTQLIEAGVDIDFGTVIRYLAGLDSIAQAAGRCNRNGARPKIGRVFVVNPEVENLDRLEDIRKGRDSAERVLEEHKEDSKQFDEDILSPKALERYYQYYFYERSDLMDYPLSSKSVVGRDDNLFELLSTNNFSLDAYQRNNQQSSPQFYLRQSFKTASTAFQSIDSPTRGVIVPYGKEGERIINELCAAQYLGKQYRLLKEAQRYSVNVFPYMFNKLIEQKVIREIQKDTGIFYLDKHYYSKYSGMSDSPVLAMELLYC